RPPHRVHRGLEREQVADVDGLQERHPVDRGRHHARAGVADSGGGGRLVAQLHHRAAVHEAGDVGIGRPHPLDEDGARLADRSRLHDGSVRYRSNTEAHLGGFMPGMTGRMSTVIKDKISRLLDKAEEQGETLDYSYQKQLESLQNVKKGIADVVTAKKRLQMQSQKLEQSVVKLDTQARQALAAGNEELARTALERKNVAQTELQGLDQQVTELEAQQAKLTDSEQKLRQKIEAFRTKKEVIKAQY